ncbi:MAG: TonB-dependent receptor, partial [Prosthecobacter sp.]|nr:TonB-dependent receptor [Prosthecobacter sp.]
MAACFWVAAALLACPVIEAQKAEDTLANSLADLSIEQLLNESVTSVTKTETRQVDSPAAISVLSNDDVQRSGATTLADALRLVPGMNVGAVNSSQFAVSARGFSSVFANKMLVLMDGRAVYSPIFSGVFWDLQRPMLEDIDRIEVIRGPGAAVWGANAMNGVINVVSRSARETQGGFTYLGGGNMHQAMAGGRYGGMIGDDIYYRVFASYQSNDDYLLPGGQSAQDGWHAWHGGFRIDQYADPDTHLTWQADATVLDLDDGASDAYNFNTLGRWTRQLSGRSSIELQAYYDRTYRNEAMRARIVSDTFDFTAQHSFGLGIQHDITWGLGYRFIANSVGQTNATIKARKSDFNLSLFNLFVQDEWQMVPDKLTVTTGAKLEHNDYTGFELQPSLRVVFKPTDKQTIWAAVSRAVRTPSEVEGGDLFAIAYGAPFAAPGGPYVPTIVGNGDPAAEVLWAYEMGYRVQPHERVNVDAAAFYNHYTDLLGIGGFSRFIPGIPVGTAELPFANLLSAETYGGEISVTVVPADAWRLSASYSLLLADFHGPAAADPAGQERNIPTQQVVLRSSHDFAKRASL